MKKLLLASAVALALPLAAFAQTGTGAMSDPTTSSNPPASMGAGTGKMAAPGGMMTTTSTTMASLSATDKTFIHAAAIAGIAEVNDGRLAAQMGDDSVKQIGTRMVTDHSRANEQLAALSQQLGDPAPTQTDAKHKQMSSALKTKSGAAFDTAYLQTELTGHEKTIALFKHEASDGSNRQLKTFAQTTLPILQTHLSMIKSALQS